MGKFLDSLKQSAPRQRSEVQTRPAVAPQPTMNEEDISGEEIPFIEVGPHRSMSASPSVLAALPAPAPAATLRAAPVEPAAPRSRFAPEIIAHHQPDHPTSARYRALLTAITSGAPGEGATLLLAPALPGADAAAVLLNLAVTAARPGGRRVAVVDADPRQAAVAERLGLGARPGLSDVLAGAATLEQALQPTGQANLVALTAGGPAPAGPRLVVETTASILRQLRQRSELVFVLGPAWDGRPESAALAAACDVVYLVLPEQEAGSPRLDELLRATPRPGARFGGCILAA